jgi:phosphoserine phosphatase RsbU/P
MVPESLLREGEQPGSEAPAGSPSDRGERVCVLLIEDNPADAKLIELMVTAAGSGLFELRHVDRLSAAFEMLRSNTNIGIVLLDLSLPDSHGLDSFAGLNARAPEVPIIVLSGFDDTTTAVEAVHRGAQDYLVKGQVDGQLLIRAMRYAMERKRMAIQLTHYAEELRLKNAQLEADFNMAREIQEIFLPQQYPTFPQWVSADESALQFSHRYLPAASVGGDFFNIFSITGTTGGVFICDVMGHGMRAALVTAIMRGLVEELMPVAADAGKFLTEINRSLHAILRRTCEPFLATACYAVADVAIGELRFANAGHPSPLLLQRSSGKLQPLSDLDPHHGPALGLFEKAAYAVNRCPLAVNDLLLLFTDGLYEMDNFAHEEFGHKRLLEAVRKRSALPTEQLLDEVLEEVQGFSAGREFEDDVCLVAMEVRRLGAAK